jgi:hypothetical protein
LWSAVEDVNQRSCGTALLALYRIFGDQQAGSIDRLQRAAREIARNESIEDPIRTAAIQVCGQLQDKSALEIARKIAVEKESISLRMAAIATVGDLGDQPEIGFLEALRPDAEHEPRLQVPIQSAVDRVTRRLQAM